jgi:hypothetical protein
MNIFPFDPAIYYGTNLWRQWRAANHPELDWHQVQTTITSPTSLTFRVYVLEHKGDPTKFSEPSISKLAHTFHVTDITTGLEAAIEKRKWELVEEVYKDREDAALAAIYDELFPEPK